MSLFSYFWEIKITIINAKTIRDERGFLIEYLKKRELEERGMKFGMIYVVSILPNKFRGNHYHKKKTELMSCVYGKVKVTLYNINTKKKRELVLNSSDKDITKLLIEPNTVHFFKNNFDETAILISHSSEKVYDKDDDFRYTLK